MWKKLILLGLSLTLAACSPAAGASQPATLAPLRARQVTETPLPTPLPGETRLAEPQQPPVAEINPLTGLPPASPDLLKRRPIIVKVENIPRTSRPQWGLSSADLVYEYYSEEGATRFAAVFYGQDASMVAPIRSARFVDLHLVHMYKAVFVFGSAYEKVYQALLESDFADRLVVEGPLSCPALCRYDPGGRNYLALDTAQLQAYLVARKVDNSPQNLEGMLFQPQVPEDGADGEQLYVRFSGAIYNRWDYDPASGRYLRYVDAQDDVNRNNPVYEAATDRQTGEALGVENVVVLVAHYVPVVRGEAGEVYDITLQGSGPAYAARDGRVYKLRWKRDQPEDVLMLVTEDGSPFSMKPGHTWFEVVDAFARIDQDGMAWKFTFINPY